MLTNCQRFAVIYLYKRWKKQSVQAVTGEITKKEESDNFSAPQKARTSKLEYQIHQLASLSYSQVTYLFGGELYVNNIYSNNIWLKLIIYEVLKNENGETISKTSLEETTALVVSFLFPVWNCAYCSSCCLFLGVRWFDRIPGISLYSCSSHLLISVL